MEQDAAIIMESAKDEEIRYMTGTTTEFTLEQIKAHIKAIKQEPNRHDFAVCLKGSDEMIGELTVDIDKENKKAGFRIALASISLTGKGFGAEAIKLVQHFVFEELALNRLQLEVFSHNERGIRAYEKAGFVQEGIARSMVFLNCSYQDVAFMAILND